MPNQQVTDYIKKMREAGYADDGIKGLLLNSGHKEEDISVAFDAVDGKVNLQSKNIAPLSDHQAVASDSKKKKKIVLVVFLVAGFLIILGILISLNKM